MTGTTIAFGADPAAAELRRGARRRSALTPRYLVVRLAYSVIAVIGALSAVFVMMNASGNPVSLMLPENATAAQIALVSRAYGLNRPIFDRYLSFMGQLSQGHFPKSITYQESSIHLVIGRLPATLALSGSAIFIAVTGGILLGYWMAATRHRRIAEAVLRIFVIVQALPSFLLALILIEFLSVRFRLLPTSGDQSATSLIMPVATLVLYVLPSIARIFRASLVEAYARDHVIGAVAKGLPLRTVRARHVATNALGPTVSYIGLHLGGILGGAVVVESVFQWPGVGQLLTNSVASEDFPVTLAATFVIAVGYVVTSFVVDVILHLLDPRVGL